MVDTPSNSGRLRGPTSGPYAAPAVDYELDPNGLVFIGPNERAFIEKHIYPLVVDSAPQPSVPNRIRLVCGLCLPNTGGYVVLRPKVLNGPAGADDTFEASLLQFSLAPTRVGWPTIDPPASSRGRNVQPWTTPRRGRGTRGN